jgi:hypothetical protein
MHGLREEPQVPQAALLRVLLRCLLGSPQSSIEDLTGRGLQDLRAGVIRTPLPPSETFLDGGLG